GDVMPTNTTVAVRIANLILMSGKEMAVNGPSSYCVLTADAVPAEFIARIKLNEPMNVCPTEAA
ncbi:MAG: hypothetical protein ACRCSF_05235, partial [Mycobacteriaceae bacterium]